MKTAPIEVMHYINIYLFFNFVGIVFVGVYEVTVVVSAKLLSRVQLFVTLQPVAL